MKRKIFFIILLSFLAIGSYGQETKHNYFGIGIGANIYPIGNSYNQTSGDFDPFLFFKGGRVVNSGSANFSFIYEYYFNKRIFISTEPSYIFTLLQFEGRTEFFFQGW